MMGIADLKSLWRNVCAARGSPVKQADGCGNVGVASVGIACVQRGACLWRLRPADGRGNGGCRSSAELPALRVCSEGRWFEASRCDVGVVAFAVLGSFCQCVCAARV